VIKKRRRIKREEKHLYELRVITLIGDVDSGQSGVTRPPRIASSSCSRRFNAHRSKSAAATGDTVRPSRSRIRNSYSDRCSVVTPIDLSFYCELAAVANATPTSAIEHGPGVVCLPYRRYAAALCDVGLPRAVDDVIADAGRCI
jgi:hypothetical protein